MRSWFLIVNFEGIRIANEPDRAESPRRAGGVLRQRHQHRGSRRHGGVQGRGGRCRGRGAGRQQMGSYLRSLPDTFPQTPRVVLSTGRAQDSRKAQGPSLQRQDSKGHQGRTHVEGTNGPRSRTGPIASTWMAAPQSSSRSLVLRSSPPERNRRSSPRCTVQLRQVARTQRLTDRAGRAAAGVLVGRVSSSSASGGTDLRSPQAPCRRFP